MVGVEVMVVVGLGLYGREGVPTNGGINAFIRADRRSSRSCSSNIFRDRFLTAGG